MRSLALVVNPVSGRGAARAAAGVALRTLEDAGLSVQVHETEGPGEAAGWVRGHQEELDAVVAVGGDGTLREIIEGVDREGLAVGLIPVGTANVVARDLRIPRKPAAAAALIVRAPRRRIDVGRVNGRPFLAMVGVGIDGEIVRSLCAARRGPISMLTYVKPGLAALLRFRCPPMKISVDGAAVDSTAFGLVVCNTRNYGGLFAVTPRATVGDGWLDYQLRRRPGRSAVLCYSLAAAFRRETRKGMAEYGRGRVIRVECEVPVPVQVDGDYFGSTPLEISIEPGRIEILAPEPPHGREARPS